MGNKVVVTLFTNFWACLILFNARVRFWDALDGHIGPSIMLIIEYCTAYHIFVHIVHFFLKHVSFLYPFLKPQLTTINLPDDFINLFSLLKYIDRHV